MFKKLIKIIICIIKGCDWNCVDSRAYNIYICKRCGNKYE